MNPRRFPIVGTVFDAGPNDSMFDLLLVAGPILILTIAFVGRSLPTTLLALGYVLAVLGRVLWKAAE